MVIFQMYLHFHLHIQYIYSMYWIPFGFFIVRIYLPFHNLDRFSLGRLKFRAFVDVLTVNIQKMDM